MADAEAIRILQSRRGSMYDPLIVDTFIAIHSANTTSGRVDTLDESVLGTAIHDLAVPAVGQSTTTVRHSATAQLDEIAASTEETLVLYDLALGLTGHVDLEDVGDASTYAESFPLPSLFSLFTMLTRMTWSRCMLQGVMRHT
jgi:hypothetical protein